MTPRENPTLLGHASAQSALQDALKSSRLHHAWLITGPEGIGKASLAYRFARRLLAGPAATLEMDPAHLVFRRVAANTHADLLTIEREWDDKKKRMKKQIAVENAREIAPFLHLTAAEAGWRVVLIDGAEDLNASSANALLKLLEEPPARAVLILVCNAPGRLLPTIRSRCRHLPLAPLASSEMADALAMYLPNLPQEDRATLATLAEGSPGRALALAEDGGLKIAATIAEILDAGPNITLLRGYEIADTLRDQDAFETFMALLQRGIANAVTATIRGTADPAQLRLVAARSLLHWADTAESLQRLVTETERANMDRRQAVIASLALLKAA